MTTNNKCLVKNKVNQLNLIFILILSLINFSAKSQVIQTYKGNFGDGFATYQYYEDENQERIYHGKFTYSKKYSVVTGNFKNNLKDGIWTYVYQYDNSYTIDYEKILGSFVDGNMNGDWTYIHYKKNKQTGKYEEYRERHAQFKNNAFFGSFSLKEENMYYGNGLNDIRVLGSFDDYGLLDSTCSFEYTVDKKSFETTFKFKSGFIYSSFSRNLSTGEIVERFDSINFLNSFIKNYDINTHCSKVNNELFIKEIFRTQVLRQDGQASITDINLERVDSIWNNSFYTSYAYSIWEHSTSLAQSKTEAEDILIQFINFWVEVHLGNRFEINRGSNPSVIYPYARIDYLSENGENQIKKLLNQNSENEEREKEQKLKLENEIIEQRRKNEKYLNLVFKGDSLFANKNFNEALREYSSAYYIESSREIKIRIKKVEDEINTIDSLQRIRAEKLYYLKTRNKEIDSEKTSLRQSLETEKNIYGRNYELCMSQLSKNFNEYFVSLDSLFRQNKTTGLIIQDSWNELDQKALDLLVEVIKEFDVYEKFHKSVKEAFEVGNKEKLKLLKSSDEPMEIINKF